MLKKLILLITGAIISSTALNVAASGYSSGSYGGGNNDVPRKAVDQNYETGKAIFSGRQRGEPSLEYCIDLEGEKVPVKRKSVKAFKGSSYSDFANSLYQCDQPEKLIAEQLTHDSLLYVVYYLNKRHKLGLRGN